MPMLTLADQTEDVDALFHELDTQGIVTVPNVVNAEQLASMQKAFGARLKRLRWNNVDGYEKTEPFREMVHDVLQLDQGFVDIALHPSIKGILNRYLTAGYELTEAKGWRSLPTKRDFHGWHGDAWYEQEGAMEIHREVKLAVYLTDVTTGHFEFIRGSHRKMHPRTVSNAEVDSMPNKDIARMTAKAGTVMLFDTSGIHRQSVPMLEPRVACFYNYHHPEVRLAQGDVREYRYHPLILNAAFLGNLSAEDQSILGFGRKSSFIHAYERPRRDDMLEDAVTSMLKAKLKAVDFSTRVKDRTAKVLKR